MLDDTAREKFLDNLPKDMRSIVLHLEGKEAWVFEDDPDVHRDINEIGALLSSHQKISKLHSMDTRLLVKLLVCMSLTRFFSFWSEMSDYNDYSKLIAKAHNDMTHGDSLTENYQRALISRLQTIVRHTMIARVYGEDRLNAIKEVLKA